MRPATVQVRHGAGAPHRAVAIFGDFHWPAAIGRSGITRRKREGDGATPAGILQPLRLLYRADRMTRPKTGLPLTAIRPDDGWCDDPAHGDYNRQVRLPHPASHERLSRADSLYDFVVVLDWNISPVRHALGSAIFLHLAPPDGGPTAGCIAVTPEVMRRLLETMDTRTRIVVG